ncbi:MAG: hypothetical protein ACLQU1_17210 [Bryobacteraceae bacterium]
MPRVRSILEYAILLLALAALPTAQAQIKILSVVNSASFQAGLPAGGALATVFCTGLPTPPGTYTAPTSPPLPLYLAGVQVQVNSAVAPVLAVVIPQAGDSAPAQINFQVPLERNSTASTAVNSDQGTLFIRTVDASGVPNGAGSAVLTPVPNAGQGAFFQDANGYAIAFHNSDNAPVTVQNPAHAGETITAYADDLFLVWPPPPIAMPVAAQPLYQLGPSQGALSDQLSYCCYLYLQTYPSYYPSEPPGTTGGYYTNTPALQTVSFQLAPDLIGVEQITFVVPANQQPGNWPLFFDAGSCPNGNPTPGACGYPSMGAVASPYVLLPVG